MDSFNNRNSQKESQKPQTKTIDTKTTNTQSQPTEIVRKLFIPAFISIVAGFFIVGIIHSSNAQDKQEYDSLSDSTENIIYSDSVKPNTNHKQTSSSPEISPRSSQTSESENANENISEVSRNSVSIKSSVSISTHLTVSNDKNETKPVVTVNGQEKELSRTGRFKERCRTENVDTTVNIRIDNDSAGDASSVNINSGVDCME